MNAMLPLCELCKTNEYENEREIRVNFIILLVIERYFQHQAFSIKTRELNNSPKRKFICNTLEASGLNQLYCECCAITSKSKSLKLDVPQYQYHRRRTS